MRQVFQRNRPLRAFGLRNYPFGKTVVDMFGKSALLTRQVSQACAAVLCAQPLQLHPEPPMPITHLRVEKVPGRTHLQYGGTLFHQDAMASSFPDHCLHRIQSGVLKLVAPKPSSSSR
jgi:hypothetical protein